MPEEFSAETATESEKERKGKRDALFPSFRGPPGEGARGGGGEGGGREAKEGHFASIWFLLLLHLTRVPIFYFFSFFRTHLCNAKTLILSLFLSLSLARCSRFFFSIFFFFFFFFLACHPHTHAKMQRFNDSSILLCFLSFPLFLSLFPLKSLSLSTHA